MSQLKGGGGKKQTAPTPTNTPDNLRSEDTVEIVLGVTEGPWRGLTNGHKSVNVGDTVLQRQDGEYNFQDFEVKTYPGNAFPDPLTFKLGGESSNFQVGVATTYGVPLTRQTEHGNIDAIDIRMVVQQLYTSQESGKSPGVFDATFQFRIRYKPLSSSTWSEWSGAGSQAVGNGNPYVQPRVTWSELVQQEADSFFDPSTGQTWRPSDFDNALNWYTNNGGSNGGVLRITGKTTSTYVKEYRIPVQRIPEPYLIQIVRVSPDSSLSGDPKYVASVTWESFQTIDSTPKRYPHTGFLQISGRSTDQFTSIPQFSGEGDGMLVRVPTNYNPDTHTYTGVWDGNFKESWTNDPVWILYEAIHNNRWGWSTYTPVSWSRYEAYELSQITNFKLSNGQPRYTFNAYLTEAMDGREFCRYIAGSFNSVIVDDDNGNVRVLMDKDDPAVAIFGPESIVGDFEYTYTDTNTRFNDITAVFRNPDIDYNEDRRGIKDDAHIAQFGRIPFDFVAVGTTNENEAVRKASRRLVSATTETEMVNFKTNRKAQYLAPYDVVLITDPYKGYGISGRFKSFSGSTVQLRDPIYLETGVTYAIDFEDPSGIITRTLTGVTTGFTSTLTLSGAVPGTVNQKAQFSLKQDGAGYGLPKPYRVLDITRNGEDDYSIMAIEINRNKFAAEDNAELVGEPRYSFPLKKEPAGPSNLKVTNLSRAAEDGTMIYEVRYDFTPPSDPYVTEHYVRYRLHDESEYTVRLSEGTGGVITLPRPGQWVFEAQSRNIWSQQSPWASATPTSIIVDKAGGVQQGGSILSATGGLNQITVKVAYPTNQTDIRYVNVYTSLTNSNAAATFAGKTDSDTFSIAGLSGVQSRYIFIKFEDNLGNLGPFTSSTGALATTTTATSTDIGNGTITPAKFAPGVSPVESVSTLPTTGNFEGRMVLLSTDGKLYSYTGGAWKAVVADVSGSGIASVNSLPTGLTIADEGRVVYLKSDNKLYRWDGTQWIANYNAEDISGQITNAQIANATIDRTKFASGIVPTEILSALPTTGNFTGRMVYLTTDNKLYRYNGTSFISTLAAADISGTLASTQIPGLDASKITSGQFTNAYIANGTLDATKFASSIRPVEILSALPAQPQSAGRTVFLTTDNKLYRSTGSAWVSSVAATDVSGQLTNAQLAAIDASKLIGQIVDTQLAALSASKITGQLTNAQLAAIDASKVAGTLTDAQLAGISASKLVGQIVNTQLAAIAANKVTGTLTDAQLAGISSSKLVGQIVDTQLAGLSASKITGQLITAQIATNAITVTQIADGAITTPKMTANSINADRLVAQSITANLVAANAITASKINVGNFDNLYVDAEFKDASYLTLQTGWAITQNATAVAALNSANVLTSPVGNGTTTQAASTAYLNVGAANPQYISVESDKTYRVSVDAFVESGFNGRFYLSMYYYNAAGSEISSAAFLTAGADYRTTPAASNITLKNLTAAVNMPAGAARASYRFYVVWPTATASTGRVHFANPRMMKMSDGELIVDGAITSEKILARSILASNIATDAITANEIAANAVTVNELAANSVNASKIVALSITANELAANSVNASKIVANSITANEIAANAVTVSELAANSVNASKIVANSITAGQIAALTITANELAANSVNASKIVALSITANELAANSVNASKIVANSITAAQIAANTITANEIAGSTITGNKIAGNTITAANIAADTITAGQIAAGAITSSEIAAKSVTTNKLLVVPTNMFPDPYFRELSVTNTLWTVYPGWYYEVRYAGNFFDIQGFPSGAVLWADHPNFTGTIHDTRYIHINNGSLQQGIEPGRTYRVRANVYNGLNANLFVTIEFFNSLTGQSLGWGTGSGLNYVPPGSLHGVIDFQTIAPAGADNYRILAYNSTVATLTGLATVTNIQVALAASASMIVDGAIIADKIAANAITASKILGGSITGDKIAGNTITADKLVANSITAGQIAAGAIGADQLAANAIQAKHLTIGNFDNIIPDGNYQDPSFWNDGAPSGKVIPQDAGPAWPLPRVLRIEANGTMDTYTKRFNVEPGATYKVTFRAYTAAISAGGWLQPVIHVPGYTWINMRGSAALGYVSSAVTVPSSLPANGAYLAGEDSGEVSFMFTNPTGVTSNFNREIQFRFAGNFTSAAYFYVKITRVSDTTLIADGAITTNKIVANAITAAKIATGTITANEIAGGTITAAKIAGGTITGDKLAGTTITGDKIAANTITVGNLSVANLAAINANLGTVTAGYIQAWTGITFFDLNNSRLQLGNPANTTYVQRFGFIGSNLSTWYGPNSVAVGSETIANSKWAQSAVDGKIYIGGSELTLPAGEQGFTLSGTPSPVLSAFNSPTASASVSLTGPAPVGDVMYRWEQTGGTPATMSGQTTSTMTANIGVTTGGVSQFRVWVSDDQRTKFRDIRIRFRSTI